MAAFQVPQLDGRAVLSSVVAGTEHVLAVTTEADRR